LWSNETVYAFATVHFAPCLKKYAGDTETIKYNGYCMLIDFFTKEEK
jgi:hypothetical protein